MYRGASGGGFIALLTRPQMGGEEAKCLLSSATNCHLAISHAHFAHDLLFYTLSYYFFAQHYTYETFISTGLNRCTCKREVIKSSCGLGQSNHKSWPSQNSQPLPFKSPHGPMVQPYRQIFIWHVSFHDPVYKVFTGAYDAWTHFNVVSQGQNLLERTFPLHMTLNSDICCPVQRACSPSATEQAGKMLWKIVQFATRAVSYGGKSSLPSQRFTPFTSYQHRFWGLSTTHKMQFSLDVCQPKH